ncbi:MAG: DNA-binding protein WhiA [Firmicutes bacterium]|nr:DNA-binding protein WhiA [Bacillota bacterium]
MSFSSLVKNELCRINIKEECCLKAELAAVVAIGGIISFTDNSMDITIITENAAFARRTYLLFKELLGFSVEVKCRKGKKLKKHTSYILTIADPNNANKVIKDLNIQLNMDERRNFPTIVQDVKKIITNSCCKRSYLRGAFLAGGSISDPEKTYHIELTTRFPLLAYELKEMISDYNLNAKIIKRKGYYVIYLKEGDHIVDFLNIIGAHSALLNMENIRILKDMRNNVNRIVNCETANLEKTVNASVRQIQNIEYIRDYIGFDKLPKNLREIAELRLQYSDASLKELGEMLEPPLGKSGVNHRLRRLEKIAKDGMDLKKEQKSSKRA